VISAFRAGEVAGAAAYRETPGRSEEEQKRMGLAVIAMRKQQGIAHIVPESEFLMGFVDGYRKQTPFTDGLQMYSEIMLKKVSE